MQPAAVVSWPCMFDEKRSSDFMLQSLTGHEASIYYDSPDYMVDVTNALLQNKLQKVWKLYYKPIISLPGSNHRLLSDETCNTTEEEGTDPLT